MVFNDKTKYVSTLAFLIFISVMAFYLSSPPRDFPVGITFSIESGSGLQKVSEDLLNEKMIRSKVFFQFLVILRGGEKRVLSGDYFFIKKTNVFNIVKRLSRGIFEAAAARITIPEGYSNKEITDVLLLKLKGFDKEKFITLAEDKEGFLFPDTYLFFPTTPEEEVIRVMNNNFNKKIEPLQDEINKSGHSLKEIITMASIIEKEAIKENDRQMISGILWKRIQKGIPLQVDAVFMYLLGKGTDDLSLKDLEFSSPYNTYRNKGLPPGSINNPGLSAIKATLNPAKSNYLFYLHDKSGIIHYARTFEEHKRNKAKYLK